MFIRRTVALTLLISCMLTGASAQSQTRKEVAIPDIPGYHTLKCDFHIHSVFSDGLVWPSVRVDEAWREGLDAIAITEHIELRNDEVLGDHNRAWEIARARAQRYGLICIHGTEITRSMPPGHFNALFIEDANAADTSDFLAAVEAMVKQGAFILHNHPGWRGQQPDGVSRWYPVHQTLLERGWLHGLEVVNEREYYPAVQRWCAEKTLTVMGNSDIHQPIHMFFDIANGDHRPMTLVFAAERTESALRDALFARRTAVWHQDFLIGEAQWLAPLYANMTKLTPLQSTLKGTGRASLALSNSSDLPLHLKAAGEHAEVIGPVEITVPPHRTVRIHLRGKNDVAPGRRTVILPYVVENFRIASDSGLPVTLEAELIFVPVE